ncbi:MAG: hypothetical protein IPG63_06230 [Xanthomonadales bacterium]|nr:hypothetical protein [Xanthomonadales bacterium]
MKIELMPGEWFQFHGQRLERSQSGSTTWIGVSAGDAGFLTLTKNGLHVVGAADVGIRQFRLKGPLNGRIVVRETLPATGAFCEQIDTVPKISAIPETPKASMSKSMVVVDLMVLMSNEAVAHLGWDWKTDVDNFVANMNQSFVDSSIAARVRVVKYAQIRDSAANGTNVANQVSNVFSLLSNASQPFSTIPSERNQVGADIVLHLITRLPNSTRCGAANAYRAGSNTDVAFAVASVNCPASDHTFTHEAGHLLGGIHDSAFTTETQAVFPYAFGYTNRQIAGANFRTLMGDGTFAGGDACSGGTSGCPRINRWSSPHQQVEIAGQTVPIVAEADAAKSNMVRTIQGSSDFYDPVEGMASLVARHRSPVAVSPGSPTNFVADSYCGGIPREFSWRAGTGVAGWYELYTVAHGDVTEPPYTSPTSTLDARSLAVTVYSYRMDTTFVYLRSCNTAGCSSWITGGPLLPLGIPPCR